MKKIFAILLALCLFASLLPMTVMAAGRMWCCVPSPEMNPMA